MSERTTTGQFLETPPRNWVAGAAGGLLGGVVMGVVLQLVGLMAVIGLLVGVPTALGGWVVHLLVSVGFGVLFGVVVSQPFMSDLAGTVGGTVGLGVVYGALLEVVTGGVILPLIVNASGGADLPVPLLPIPGLAGALTLAVGLGVGHLLYGAVLGAVFASLEGTPMDAGL